MRFERPATMKLNREETLALLASGQWPTGDTLSKYTIQSLWICDRLNEYEKDGYVYNAPAQRRLEAEEGLPPSPENGSILSVLIYNAQTYRREDRLRAQGFQSLTADMVKQAIERNLMIEVQGETLLGGEARTVCRPVQTGEGFAVLLPRKRNKGYRANHGHIARLVDKKGVPCSA
mgnify:CR=1 FL=1